MINAVIVRHDSAMFMPDSCRLVQALRYQSAPHFPISHRGAPPQISASRPTDSLHLVHRISIASPSPPPSSLHHLSIALHSTLLELVVYWRPSLHWAIYLWFISVFYNSLSTAIALPSASFIMEDSPANRLPAQLVSFPSAIYPRRGMTLLIG